MTTDVAFTHDSESRDETPPMCPPLGDVIANVIHLCARVVVFVLPCFADLAREAFSARRSQRV